MSTVTASAIIGGSPRYRGGVEPIWTAYLHEGSGAAWQFGRTAAFYHPAETPICPSRSEDHWIQCHIRGAILDLLRLGIHLWCSPRDHEISQLLRAELASSGISGMRRLDLTHLAVDNRDRLLRLARTSPGPATTIMLSIYSPSSLRGAGASFFETCGWQGEWGESAGGQLYRTLPEDWQTWATHGTKGDD